MNKILSTSLFIFLLSLSASAQEIKTFEKYFIDETMRIDYHHIGNSDEEIVTMDKIYKYGIWAGSRTHLIDDMNLGRYCVKIYDAATNQLIYSKGFDSYFGEYKTSSDGIAGIKKTFHESAIIPYPINKIIFGNSQ